MQTKEKYVVKLFRKDGVDFDCLISENFTECEAFWKELHSTWVKCHNDKEVFILKSPIMTAFEPGLISEISLIPYKDDIPTVDDNNPYKTNMRNNGLENTLRGVGRLF